MESKYATAYKTWVNPDSTAEAKAEARLVFAHGVATAVPFALAVVGSRYKEFNLDTSRLSAPAHCRCHECGGTER